jgi:hypothetical protein
MTLARYRELIPFGLQSAKLQERCQVIIRGRHERYLDDAHTEIVLLLLPNGMRIGRTGQQANYLSVDSH